MIDFLYTSREKNFETSYVIETSNIIWVKQFATMHFETSEKL